MARLKIETMGEGDRRKQVGARSQLALVTGGSSGIGLALAKELYRDGYELVLAGRSPERLKQAAEEIVRSAKAKDREQDGVRFRVRKPKEVYRQVQKGGRLHLCVCDVSKEADCQALYEKYGEKIDLLINCAGFGVYGEFTQSSVEDEQSMLDVNCRGLHLLMKLFLQSMQRRGSGAILNVASSAGLMPGGPYMAAYYATKAYVVSLTQGVAEELRGSGSPVYVGALCPGPVETEFSRRAGIGMAVKGADPQSVAKAALRGMKQGKVIIIPGWTNKLSYLAGKLLPVSVILAVNRRIQAKKIK